MGNVTKQLYEQFLHWAQAHENEMLRELSEWVQIPSVRDNATAAPVNHSARIVQRWPIM